MHKETVRIACFAPTDVHTSSLYAFFDIFSTARPLLEKDDLPISAGTIDVKVVAETDDAVRGWHGRMVQPDLSIRDAGLFDAIVIPAIGDAHSTPEQQSAEVLDWLRENFEAGATIAALCSGCFPIADAGLLRGERATTHWAWADQFQELHPDVVLHERRAIVYSGPGHRIVTCGGGALWRDLALFIIARFLGQASAMQSAKYYLVDWGRKDGLAFSELEATRQHYDGTIKQAQNTIANGLTDENILQLARERAGLPKRTFERRFKAATGLSISNYIQQMRIERAKEILEKQNVPVDQIAIEVGYSDTTSFRRLFIKLVGVTPSEYRRRFGTA